MRRTSGRFSGDIAESDEGEEVLDRASFTRTTTMSDNTPPKHPLTLQQIAGTLSSVTHATNEILGGNPVFVAEVQNIYKSFLSSPTTIKLLGFNPTSQPHTTTPSEPLRKEISEMKKAIDALSKAVKVPLPGTGANQPKITPITPTTPTGTTRAQGKTPGKNSTHTYASLAASPAHPSAVLELKVQQPEAGPLPAEICRSLNSQLKDRPAHSQVHISAVRWTVRGNLVITAGPNTSEHHLKAALPDIASLLRFILGLPNKDSYQIRANTRWSRILLNRVPTGATSSTEAASPNQCHDSLLADNPSYATLTITQRPSWVKDPSSYSPGSVSSLSFAFEDPDGSLAKKLLSEKELYIFGTSATVKKWKQKTPPKKPTQPPPAEAAPQTHTHQPDTQAPGRTQSSRRAPISRK